MMQSGAWQTVAEEGVDGQKQRVASRLTLLVVVVMMMMMLGHYYVTQMQRRRRRRLYYCTRIQYVKVSKVIGRKMTEMTDCFCFCCWTLVTQHAATVFVYWNCRPLLLLLLLFKTDLLWSECAFDNSTAADRFCRIRWRKCNIRERRGDTHSPLSNVEVDDKETVKRRWYSAFQGCAGGGGGGHSAAETTYGTRKGRERDGRPKT